MEIVVEKNPHRVVAVGVSDSSFHTQNGLRVGLNLVDVEKVMGPPETIKGNVARLSSGEVRSVIYNSGNLNVSFTRAGDTMADRPRDTVQQIIIQLAGAHMF